MPASAWMRRWRSAYAADDCADVIIRAAARGDSLDQMLDLGAQALLSTGTADRAGLWLSGERRGESPRGRVIEAVASPIPIPEQWKHLDISTPFLRAALESMEPLHLEFVTEAAMPRLGPLMGMRSAVWIPIRTRNCIYGLAMVAYSNRRSGARLELGRLRARADEVALAIAHHHDTRRSELAAEGMRSQARLSRAILSDVSLDSILPQIARAARIHVQAEFIAVGRVDGLSIRAEGWDGPEAWRSLLQQKTILEIWQKVLDEVAMRKLAAKPSLQS